MANDFKIGSKIRKNTLPTPKTPPKCFGNASKMLPTRRLHATNPVFMQIAPALNALIQIVPALIQIGPALMQIVPAVLPRETRKKM